MSIPTDAELVERCREGDAAAWDELTERYADIVFNIARKNGLSAFDAGDVVQDVFVALLKNIGKLRRTSRLLAWIVRTTRRAAWKNARKRNTAAGHERAAAERREAHVDADEGDLQSLEDAYMVRLAYAEIGERCRRLLDALFLDEARTSYAQIAEQLGMAVGSIGPTRQRCLEELRVALAAVGFVPDSEQEVSE